MMPDKYAEWRQTQTSRALLLHALPLDDGVIGVPLCFCGCLLLSVLQNPFLKVKGCEGCPVSTSLQRLLQCRVIIRLDLKGISRYSSSLPPSLSRCSVGHDVALRRCGRGLFCQSVPKPHIYFKQGGASNWSLAAP